MTDSPDPGQLRQIRSLDALIRSTRQDLEALEAERDRLREETQHEELNHVLEHPEEAEIHLDDLRELGSEAWAEVLEALMEFKRRLTDVVRRHRP